MLKNWLNAHKLVEIFRAISSNSIYGCLYKVRVKVRGIFTGQLFHTYIRVYAYVFSLCNKGQTFICTLECCGSIALLLFTSSLTFTTVFNLALWEFEKRLWTWSTFSQAHCTCTLTKHILKNICMYLYTAV